MRALTVTMLGLMAVLAAGCAPQTRQAAAPPETAKTSPPKPGSDSDLCLTSNEGVPFETSIAACTRLIEGSTLRGKDLADAYHARGFDRRRNKQYETAITDFKKALSLRPEMKRGWHDLCLAYADLEQWAAALDAIEQGLTVAPDSGYGHGLHAYVLRNLNRLDESERAITIALALDPKDDWTRREFAWLRFDQGHRDEALEAVQAARTRDPDDAENSHGIAYMLIDLDRHREALDAINTAIRQRGSARDYNIRGFILTDENSAVYDLTAGTRDLEKAISLDPRSHYSVYHLAAAQALADRPARAMATLRKGLDLRLDSPKARRVIRILLRNGHADEAEEAARLLNQRSQGVART